MTSPPKARAAWILLAAILIWTAAARTGWALSYYWGAHPDKERLVFVLKQPLPAYTLTRSGKQALTLKIPAKALSSEPTAKPVSFSGSTLLKGVKAGPGGVEIQLRTPAFGYIQFSVKNQRKIVIDLFRDPLGVKWQPAPGKKQTPAQASPPPAENAPAKAAKNAPPSAPQQQATIPQPQSAKPQPQAAAPTPQTTAKPASQPAAANKSAAKAPVLAPYPADTLSALPAFQAKPPQPAAPQTPETPAATAPTPPSQAKEPTVRPFFAVPYTYRAKINAGGPEDWKEPEFALPPVMQDTPGAAPSEPTTPPSSQGTSSDAGRMTLPASPPEPAQANSPLAQPNLADVKGELRGHVLSPSEEPVVPPQVSQRLMEPDQPATQSPAPVSQPMAPTGQAASSEPAPIPYDPAQYLVSKEEGAYRARVAPPGVLPQELIAQMSSPAAPAATPAASAAAKTAAAPATATSAKDAALLAEIESQLGPEKKSAVQAPASAPPQDQAGAAEQQPAEAAAPAPEGEMAAPAGEGKGGEKGQEKLDTDATLAQAGVDMSNANYQTALDQYLTLRDKPEMITRPLTVEERHTVTYALGDIYFAMYGQDKKAATEHYTQVSDALNQSMSINPKSDRVPTLLLQLGTLNLKVDNLKEADAYFNILRSKYPSHENVPLTYYYWGDYYFDHEQYQKAADMYQYVVQKYPDVKYVREASLGLAKSLVKLGFHQQAYQIADYIEKRWPRFYAEYPPFLKLLGDVNFAAGKFDKAKVSYWTYYNLDPNQEEVDLVLAKLGDIYVKTNHTPQAREVYQEAATRFPDKDGGLVSLMRLAEQGIYDEPTVKDMFTVFDHPVDLNPAEIYKKILTEHASSQLAPLAQLKLSIWSLWNRKYADSIAQATEFAKKFPGNTLQPRADEIATQAFDQMVAANVAEENYERVVETWRRFPELRALVDKLQPATRLSVALSSWKRNDPDTALEMTKPFFLGHIMPTYSEMALHLALTIYLEHESWQNVLDLAERIVLWQLTPPTQQELDYAKALAFENLGQPDKGQPLWEKLAQDQNLDADKRGYPMYFLAMAARDRGDLHKAYDYAHDALGQFLTVKGPKDKSKIKDLFGLLIDVTENSGRLSEALKFAMDYLGQVNKEDPEWPAVRYRLAQLYKKGADLKNWESVLQGLKTDVPDTLYGRMAASELATHQLEQNANQYKAMGNL